MIDLSGFVHQYPYLSVAVFLYIASELLPEKMKFRNLVALSLQGLALFAAFYQFNLFNDFVEVVKKAAQFVLKVAS